MEKYIGKVILVHLPGMKRPQYRWIVRKRDDERLIIRVPKSGILIRELNLKRCNDYGKDLLLPFGSKPYVSPRTMKGKKIFKKYLKTKTRKKSIKNHNYDA